MQHEKNDACFLQCNTKKAVKKVFRFTNENSIDKTKIGFKSFAYPRMNKPIPEFLYKLSKRCKMIFAKNLNSKDYKYFDNHDYVIKNDFLVPLEKCSLLQKRMIEKRNKKMEKFARNVNKTKENDIGVITLVSLRDVSKPQIIQLEITPMDLVNFGVLPKEVGFEKKKKALIHSNNCVYIDYDGKISNQKDSVSSFVDRILVDKSQLVNVNDKKYDKVEEIINNSQKDIDEKTR